MNNTNIRWTEKTCNPVTGCTETGVECKNCYARRIAERMQHNSKSPYYGIGFKVTLHPNRLSEFSAQAQPSMIFVCSMADLFHDEVPTNHIDKVFDAMERVGHHIYQITTKRSSRMRDYVNSRYAGKPVPKHIWLGVSVGVKKSITRIDDLRQIRDANRWISFEPLLESLAGVDLSDIGWVVVGGESGAGFRKMETGWARELRDTSLMKNIPFFFKQHAAFRPKKLGYELDGQTWQQYPQSMLNHLTPKRGAA